MHNYTLCFIAMVIQCVSVICQDLVSVASAKERNRSELGAIRILRISCLWYARMNRSLGLGIITKPDIYSCALLLYTYLIMCTSRVLVGYSCRISS